MKRKSFSRCVHRIGIGIGIRVLVRVNVKRINYSRGKKMWWNLGDMLADRMA